MNFDKIVKGIVLGTVVIAGASLIAGSLWSSLFVLVALGAAAGYGISVLFKVGQNESIQDVNSVANGISVLAEEARKVIQIGEDIRGVLRR